jgi:deoxyhypusine monooxygenase
MSAFAPRPTVPDLVASLGNASNPIGQRTRASYFLRQYFEEDPENTEVRMEVVSALGNALKDKKHGALMRHELAYIMGQLRSVASCDVLEEVLVDVEEDVMVRHECGEALGAIGEERSRTPLEFGSKDSAVEVSETCMLALERLQWLKEGADAASEPMSCACMASPYHSVDPAPPHPTHLTMSVEELGARLLDPEQPLFERYRCMFSLRNKGGEVCVFAILCLEFL